MRVLILLLLLLAVPVLGAEPTSCLVCSVEQGQIHFEDCPLSQEAGGQTVYFCKEDCQARFNSNPEDWLARYAALKTPAATGGKMPAFEFPLEPAGVLASEHLKGKVLLINCWATWCGPCMEEMPALVKLQQKYKERGLVVIGLSFDEQPAQYRQGLDKLGLNFVSVLAKQPEVASFLEKIGPVKAIPVSFIVDAQGTIVHRLEGSRTLEEFEAMLEPLLPAAAEEHASGGSLTPS